MIYMLRRSTRRPALPTCTPNRTPSSVERLRGAQSAAPMASGFRQASSTRTVAEVSDAAGSLVDNQMRSCSQVHLLHRPVVPSDGAVVRIKRRHVECDAPVRAPRVPAPRPAADRAVGASRDLLVVKHDVNHPVREPYVGICERLRLAAVGRCAAWPSHLQPRRATKMERSARPCWA